MTSIGLLDLKNARDFSYCVAQNRLAGLAQNHLSLFP